MAFCRITIKRGAQILAHKAKEIQPIKVLYFMERKEIKDND